MHWIKLTQHGSKRPIHVNLQQASSFELSKSGRYTIIWFLAGEPDGVVKVEETPEEILSKPKLV